jgi:hypothetical protein
MIVEGAFVHFLSCQRRGCSTPAACSRTQFPIQKLRNKAAGVVQVPGTRYHNTAESKIRTYGRWFYLE